MIQKPREKSPVPLSIEPATAALESRTMSLSIRWTSPVICVPAPRVGDAVDHDQRLDGGPRRARLVH